MKKLIILLLIITSCNSNVNEIENNEIENIEPEIESLDFIQYEVTDRKIVITEFKIDGCEYIIAEERYRYTSLVPIHKTNCKNH